MKNITLDNDTNKEDKKATVSIRNMSLSLWYKAGYKCKCNGITLSEYVTELISKDIGEDTSNQQ